MQISLKMSIMLVWELFSSIATIPAISASAAPENENRENLQYGFRFSSRICITEIGISSRSSWSGRISSPDTSEISAFTAMEIHFFAPASGISYCSRRSLTVFPSIWWLTRSFRNCSRRIGRLRL